MSRTRRAVLSGTWYPGDPGRLARDVDRYLAGADPDSRPAGRPLIAVAPHAGYRYSGETAGRVLGLLGDRRPDRIFILAPNHRRPLRGIALSDADAFATPLGAVPVDTATNARLAGQPLFGGDGAAHTDEHAIEIQLPFLQRLWPDDVPAIVPLIVPALGAADSLAAAGLLGPLIDDNSLLLVSTDFTHYGAEYGYVPFREDIPAALERLDSGAILRILAGDGPGLRDYGHRTGITMCGLAGAALALDCGLAEGYEGGLLHYARSGDRDGNYEFSVSYAAILLTAGSEPRRGGSHA